MRARAAISALATAALVAIALACGSSASDATNDDGGGSDEAGTKPHPGGDADGSGQDGTVDAPPDGPPLVDTLAANRERLLGTYLDWLKSTAGTPQTNGLDGANLTDVCSLWNKLDPSSQAVFRTLTARMQGSTLGADGTSILVHVTKLYRLTGGQNPSGSDPGSCGGGEYNRMIMSMDKTLHDTFVAANAAKGKKNASGKYDINDVPTHSNSFWRDSHDIGGPHAPFDLSDETDPGGPRGQVQFFKNPAAANANNPLQRTDLQNVIDPYGLEMDQDYDCPHNSNPLCSYVLYGDLCIPQAPKVGTDIYTANYGSFDPTWNPSGC